MLVINALLCDATGGKCANDTDYTNSGHRTTMLDRRNISFVVSNILFLPLILGNWKWLHKWHFWSVSYGILVL